MPWTYGAQATGQCIYDAAIDLCQRLHIALPLLAPQSNPRNREEELSWFSLIWRIVPFELAGKGIDSGDCTGLRSGGYWFLFPVPRV